MPKIGHFNISEKNLYQRVINKIPKAQFTRIIKSIEKDLDPAHGYVICPDCDTVVKPNRKNICPKCGHPF